MKMNVITASNSLYAFFLKNDIFSFEKNFKNVIPISMNAAEEKAFVLAALLEFEKAGIITYVKTDTEYWVLRKNIDSLDQSLILSGRTCFNVADIINQFCDSIKENVEIADARNIKEKDILTLVYITNYFLKGPFLK